MLNMPVMFSPDSQNYTVPTDSKMFANYSQNLFLYFNPNVSWLWHYIGVWALSNPEVTSLMIVMK